MDSGESSYRRFLDGDEQGFVEIVKDYKDGLIFYINGYVHSLNVAQELTEDTFVKFGIKKPHFSSKSSFKTWLYSIGRNTALDYIKKHSKNSIADIDEFIDLSDGDIPEIEYFKKERNIILHKAMSRLKDEYRTVLWLFYFEEMSNAEISKITKKRVHAVETLLYRARLSLKAELQKDDFNHEKL